MHPSHTMQPKAARLSPGAVSIELQNRERSPLAQELTAIVPLPEGSMTQDSAVTSNSACSPQIPLSFPAGKLL